MSGDGLRLNLASLSAQFTKASFETGLALYRSQQVEDCSISRVNTREWSLAGTVRTGGKTAARHEVTAELEASADGDITFFSGRCNCGVSRNCRHSAALAVKAAYQSANTAVQDDAPAQPSPRPITTSVGDLFSVLSNEPLAYVQPVAVQDTATDITSSQRFPSGPSLDLFGDPAPVMPPPEPADIPTGPAPVPHLHIEAVPPEGVEQRGLLCATLRFNYGGLFHYALNDHNPVRIETTVAGEQTLLYRDLPAEHAADRALHKLGLAGDARGQFLRTFISMAQQQPWLQWLDDDFALFRAAGFEVSVAPGLASWIARADTLDARMEDDAGDLADLGAAGTGEAQWFRLSLGMNINGERRNILPLLPELLAQLGLAASGAPDSTGRPLVTLQLPAYIYLRQHDGSYWRLPCEPLRPWLQALLDILAERGQHKDASNALHEGSLRLSRLEAFRLGIALHETGSDSPVWRGAQDLLDALGPLAGNVPLPDIPAPAGLKAELRPYQLQGLRWLQFLRAHGLGGILADDMGLGKTLQTLAHIQCEKEAGRLDRPALILAPLSLMGNWQREATRFTPGLRVIVVHGQKRHRAAARMGGCDIVIAPYSLLQRDRAHWLQQAWHLVVLDEAQHIKNASSQAARVAAELNTRHRLCLSGTPMENHLGELWSLFSFLMPGFLGSAARFRALYRTPIEKQADNDRLAQLRRRITPFMLRRTKHEVATDLPDKQEVVASIELDDAQADLYESIRLSTEKTVRDALANKGLGSSQFEILEALVRLRQVCCDPRLLPTSSTSSPGDAPGSAKLDWLMETLPRMLDEGRRVLLFSQFTGMLALIEEALAERGMRWVKLTGQSQNRDAIIDRFTSGEVPLFLISLKAGGTGLNLPQADTVIHYDPWWNPAVQEQATARAHRIGQTQPVLVYRLVAQGTIEERILALQERKAALADGLYSDATARGDTLLSEDDLAALLEPLGA
ncbi:DEAD/DEAH box helicase [Polaromonas sp. UC242_47]|uniref:DEAD/DEAH box helicase n=1 Tax=Polaromonas sp. UC242_47 TaxID=3374626 RepID=UPI0037B22633